MADNPVHLVLLSGGLKSAALALDLKRNGAAFRGIHFDYGQRAAKEEKQAAVEVAAYLGAEIDFVDMGHFGDLRPGKAWSVLDAGAANESIDPSIPGLLPTMLLAAGALAIERKCRSVWVGVRSGDRHHPDAARSTFQSYEHALYRNALSCGLRLEFPFLDAGADTIPLLISKAEGRGLLHLTHSCLNGRRPACGVCRGCRNRSAMFRAARLDDDLAKGDESAPDLELARLKRPVVPAKKA